MKLIKSKTPIRNSLLRNFLFSFIIISFLTQPHIFASGKTTERLSDAALVELVQKKSFDYFLKEVNRKNGLVADRAHNFKRGSTRSPASIATVGFALTIYPIGVERGWMSYEDALELTRTTLLYFLRDVHHEHGFYYHFLDMQSGKRWGRCELSPIDTALFIAGALFAAEYFDNPEIEGMAKQLYERVNWQWMLNGGETFALAWSPERGFWSLRWDHYSENMIMYLLAIGSPTFPIPASSWKAMERRVGSYGEHRVIQMPPLFTHQYSHMWVDFRNKNDGFADYFVNSVNAALANRAFCMDQAVNYKTYGPNAWGLTASDGPFGYKAYGAPPGWAAHDGTLAPTGCIASIVFTPEHSINCMRHYYENFKDRLWGMYGFSDAFNLDQNWFDQEVIGIDQGAMVIMIENYRSEFVWEVMTNNVNLKEAMEKVGFRKGTKEVPWPESPSYEIPYVTGGMTIDGYLKDWPVSEAIVLNHRQHREMGAVTDAQDLYGEVRLAWDEGYLYFSAKVADSDIIVRKSGKNIWKDDMLELFIDPQNNGLRWNNREDFQVGFRIDQSTDGALGWSWFQGGMDPIASGDAEVRSFSDGSGYILEGSIKWEFFDILPEEGFTFQITPALHDIDRDRSEGKLVWYFQSEGEFHRFTMGTAVLVGEEG